MPLKRTLAKRSRRLDDYKRAQLLEGPDACRVDIAGYRTASTFAEMAPEAQAEALAQMKADWIEHRAELMAWWNAGENAPAFSPKPWIFPHYGSPDRLPWAARQFDDAKAK